jgi:hypothetical protein
MLIVIVLQAIRFVVVTSRIDLGKFIFDGIFTLKFILNKTGQDQLERFCKVVLFKLIKSSSEICQKGQQPFGDAKKSSYKFFFIKN